MTSSIVLTFLGLVFCGMLSSMVASGLGFVAALANGNNSTWKPLKILLYACTSGLMLSFAVSAVAGGIWLAVCSSVGTALFATVVTTFVVRLIVCLGTTDR